MASREQWQRDLAQYGNLMTVDEIAKELRVHQITVRRWLADEGLPFTRMGSTKRHPIRISKDGLIQWLCRDTPSMQSIDEDADAPSKLRKSNRTSKAKTATRASEKPTNT